MAMPRRPKYLAVELHAATVPPAGPVPQGGLRCVLELLAAKLGKAKEELLVDHMHAPGSSNSPPVGFGLGNATKIDRIEIRWPMSDPEIFTDVPVDRRIFIREAEGRWTGM